MGKHQWLSNGNLLVIESIKGRALEVAPDGEIVWEYFNLDGSGFIGIVQFVERLPDAYRALFETKKSN